MPQAEEIEGTDHGNTGHVNFGMDIDGGDGNSGQELEEGTSTSILEAVDLTGDGEVSTNPLEALAFHKGIIKVKVEKLSNVEKESARITDYHSAEVELVKAQENEQHKAEMERIREKLKNELVHETAKVRQEAIEEAERKTASAKEEKAAAEGKAAAAERKSMIAIIAKNALLESVFYFLSLLASIGLITQALQSRLRLTRLCILQWTL